MNKNERPINLATSKNGQVAVCRGCKECISFEFGPIFQLFSYDDFSVLERNISTTSPEEYFKRCPFYSKIIVNTSVPNLYFTFTEKEFGELQVLLSAAIAKYQILEMSQRNLN